MKIVDVPKLLEALGAKNVRADGVEIWASCPLGTHRDSNPSFQIRNEPGDEHHANWRCFGCHEHGGAVGLVRKAKGVGGKEARRILVNLHVSYEGAPRKEGGVEVDLRIRTLGDAPFVLPAGVVRAPLARWPGPIRAYAESRGITAWQVERWGLGYAVAGGLSMRVVFPVEDETGRLGSYSARTVVGDRKRYLTPGKDERALPGAIFGRRWWPAPVVLPDGSTVRRGRCVIVEGAIDGLAVERATGDYFGALSGSYADPAQWLHFATFELLVLLTDPDKAGDRVAEEYALAGGPAVVRARLPIGLDAQSAGSELLAEALRAVG